MARQIGGDQLRIYYESAQSDMILCDERTLKKAVSGCNQGRRIAVWASLPNASFA